MNLGLSKNNINVLYDERSGHAKTHISNHPILLKLVQTALPTLELTDPLTRVEVDARKIIGSSDLLETNESDEIVYALRQGRKDYSRFAKNRQPSETSFYVVDIRYDRYKNDWFLYTVYIGKITPSFPGGNFLPEQSKEFWSTHALVWGTQEIIEGTETTVCPW